MGLYAIKPRFQQLLRRVADWLVAHHVHPDRVTLAAVACALLGGLALWGSNWSRWTLVAVPIVALFRIALNALDGMVARDSGLARPWGEVLNEFCDRLSDIALFTGMAAARGALPLLGAAVVVAAVLSSFVGNASKGAGGKRQYGGIMGKADRMLYLSIASIVALILPDVPIFTWFAALVLLAQLVTIAQRLRLAYRDLQPAS